MPWELAYDRLLTKTKTWNKNAWQIQQIKHEERQILSRPVNAFEYKYTQWDYQEIENEVKTYFHEHVIA